MAAGERGAHLDRDWIFRLWIVPEDHGFSGLQGRPAAHEDGTQALVMLEEVGAVAKPMALHDGWILALRALLQAEHCGVEIAMRQVRRFHTDEQEVTSLRQQLS